MIRKAFQSISCAAVSAVCCIPGAFGAELRGLDLTAGAGGAQLTLELAGAATHHLFKLDHPDRVVLDLADTHLAKGVHAPSPAGVVSGVRFGRQPHGTLRVVVELRSPLLATASSGKGEGGPLVLTLGEPAVGRVARMATTAAGAVHRRQASHDELRVIAAA